MDEKKKLIVIGALTVVMLGIGTMQIVKSTSHPAPAPAAVATTAAPAADKTEGDSTDKKDDAQAPQANDLVKGSYAAHDPFKPLVDANAPVSTVAQNTAPTKPLPTRVARGEVFPPFPISKEGQLPGTVASVQGGVTTPVKPAAPEFGYQLAGIIMGRKPAAVFVDTQGAQHLVQLGGSLDGDTRLVDLDREHVVLRVKDQTKNLTLGGGNSSAK
jgi:hypothetical protein